MKETSNDHAPLSDKGFTKFFKGAIMIEKNYLFYSKISQIRLLLR